MHNQIKIGDRIIGKNYPPFVIPEVGINHEGSFLKAKTMIRDAYECGAECIKFQCHIIEDEMIKRRGKEEGRRRKRGGRTPARTRTHTHTQITTITSIQTITSTSSTATPGLSNSISTDIQT